MPNPNGYFQSACRKRIKTRLVDITDKDFHLKVTTSAGGSAGQFNVRVEISANKPFSDVGGITQSGTASLFDEDPWTAAVKTDAGPNAASANVLPLTFTNVVQTSSNVGNTWKITVVNLVITGKGGQTLTVPSITFSIPSPL